MQKYLSFIMYYGSALLLFTRKNILYKRVDRSMQIKSLDPTCMQNFRPVSLIGFEIQGLKLNNKNDKKNWRNGLCAISPMLVVQF